MSPLNRRQFLAAAVALGAAAAWATPLPKRSGRAARERRDLYAEGVASGDPDSSSVLLWTRRVLSPATRGRLHVEVSEDEAFTRVVANARAEVLAASDWTCRVLVANLHSARTYWYRFIDGNGYCSRVGRTRTAPAGDDMRPAKFAFVSCQSVNLGTLHAYRRMIAEDERAPPDERLDFVLHLGDFIYEAVWYPEDNPGGVFNRPVRDVLRYDPGQKVQMWGTVHVPATLEDYRKAYRAYLRDPDLQDARARWPFVSMWDNHEFSGYGWQGLASWNGVSRPAQTLKVAANQAWFEYQPARIRKASGPSVTHFDPPQVRDAPVTLFDAQGLGDEPNNRAAIDSLTAYRALRWGRHLDLFITDQYSYRSECASLRPEASIFSSNDFPLMFPEEVLQMLDAGVTYDGGHPPATLRYGEQVVPNFQKDEPAQTLLGARQKEWFMQSLQTSTATWKIWGCSLGTLDYRFDPQHLPEGLTRRWPGAGYAGNANRDFGTAYCERAEIYQCVQEKGISGFGIVAADRHSFWAGLAAATLPPQRFEPVGVAFITGSISSPGTGEVMEGTLSASHPLHDLYIRFPPGASSPEHTVNLLMMHGVRAALEYARTGNLERALALSDPQLAPHLKFLDLSAHGYSTVRLSADALECEFVCIPRPVERDVSAQGPPVLYRVRHRAPLWKPGQRPQLEQRVLEGNPYLSKQPEEKSS